MNRLEPASSFADAFPSGRERKRGTFLDATHAGDWSITVRVGTLRSSATGKSLSSSRGPISTDTRGSPTLDQDLYFCGAYVLRGIPRAKVTVYAPGTPPRVITLFDLDE